MSLTDEERGWFKDLSSRLTYLNGGTRNGAERQLQRILSRLEELRGENDSLMTEESDRHLSEQPERADVTSSDRGGRTVLPCTICDQPTEVLHVICSDCVAKEDR